MAAARYSYLCSNPAADSPVLGSCGCWRGGAMRSSSYRQGVCCTPAAIHRLAAATQTRTQRSKKDVHAALEKDTDGALEKDEKCCWRSRLAARARCCWRSRLAARARAASQTPHVRTQGFPGGRVPSMHAECCSKFVCSCGRAVLIFLPCMHAECCFVRSCVHARF